jgi:hypothetical protein
MSDMFRNAYFDSNAIEPDEDNELYVKSIHYLRENKKSARKLKIILSNNTIIYAESCYESWMQYGGTQNELYITMPIIEKHNKWLHGGNRPEFDDEEK